MAAAAAKAGGSSRFIGQIGDDRLGYQLVEELAATGVEVVGKRGGTTGSVVVLLHPDGERSMLTDRGAAVLLDGPDPAWLDGVRLLHVPLYSLAEGPLAATTATLIRWARERDLPVTVDVSATSVIERLGPEAVHGLLGDLRPAVILANRAEAELLDRGGARSHIATEAFVEKRGGEPAIVTIGPKQVEVPAKRIGTVSDSTGAGDAFAAGYLLAHIDGAGAIKCTETGHQLAAQSLTGRLSTSQISGADLSDRERGS